MSPASIKTRDDRVFDSWNARECFICRQLGRCLHREYKVELAIVDAELARALRTQRKDVGSALKSVPAKKPIKKRRRA